MTLLLSLISHGYSVDGRGSHLSLLRAFYLVYPIDLGLQLTQHPPGPHEADIWNVFCTFYGKPRRHDSWSKLVLWGTLGPSTQALRDSDQGGPHQTGPRLGCYSLRKWGTQCNRWNICTPQNSEQTKWLSWSAITVTWSSKFSSVELLSSLLQPK